MKPINKLKEIIRSYNLDGTFDIFLNRDFEIIELDINIRENANNFDLQIFEELDKDIRQLEEIKEQFGVRTDITVFKEFDKKITVEANFNIKLR